MDNPSSTTLSDFSRGTLDGWSTVNDGVMGGRSDGRVKLDGGHLLFEGVLRTQGGGFASMRRRLAPGEVGGMRSVVVTAQGDGRRYEVLFQAWSGVLGRQVTWRAPLSGIGRDEPRSCTVPASSLEASIRGRPVEAGAFDPGEATEIGIILADGQDGPFRLAIERIAVCREA